MQKQKKSLETLEKMTIQETQETNFTRYLEDTENIKEIRNILNFMRDTFIPKKDVEYINIENYIYFYSQIPKSLWSKQKVFYFKDGRFDALGLIGERVHQFIIHSKCLELYFKDICGLSITKCIDGEDEIYKHIKNPKKRFLSYLFYIKKIGEEKDYRTAFTKTKKIYNGRYY